MGAQPGTDKPSKRTTEPAPFDSSVAGQLVEVRFDDVANRRVYENRREIERYRNQRALDPVELRMLHRFHGRWDEVDMLDVGVGAGRTALTFAGIARSYLGIDYSQKMVTLSRAAIGENDHVHFRLMDARDLSELEPGSFHFVLFTANAIDAVGPQDRLIALGELARVLAPDGYLLLSSHSLDALPMRMPRPPALRGSPGGLLRSLRGFARDTKNALKYRRTNRGLDLDAARERGWGVARDPGHNFSLDHCYVTAETQIEQFRAVGLEVLEVLDSSGTVVDAASPGPDSSLAYVCRPFQ